MRIISRKDRELYFHNLHFNGILIDKFEFGTKKIKAAGKAWLKTMGEERRFWQTNRKRKIGIIAGVTIVAVLLVIVVYNKRLSNKIYQGYSTLSEMELDSEISATTKPFGKGVIWYSADGLSYYSGGKEVWNKAINMTAPVIDTCGDYIVMAERKSNDIYIFDIDGNQNQVTATYPVINVEVSKQGVVAATLDDGEANYIEIVGKDGTKIASGRTVLSGDGYPVDISIADDGTRLVASYLAVSNGTTQSKVVFYNFSSVGENEVDRIVGGFNHYKSTFVPDVEFINNSTAIAFGDNMFTIYSMKQKPKITYEETFEKKVKTVFYSSRYVGIVLENEDADYPYILKVYNTKGEVEYRKKIDFKYKDICFAGENVVMYDDMQCRMYSFSGTERFNYAFDKNLISIVPLKSDKYVLVRDNSIEEIQLK